MPDAAGPAGGPAPGGADDAHFAAGEPDAEALERGRLLFASECRFVRGVQSQADLLPPFGPEVAFAGRSNVGKSSLINALTNRHGLARASNQPGRTQQLNFFDLGGKLTLVDMPGYGYARASKLVKEEWQGLMFDYLRGRPTLRRVVLLLDARVPVKPSDRAVMDLLDTAAVTFQLVLTKTDGQRQDALDAKAEEARSLARAHTAAYPGIVATSSETGAGIPELRAELAAYA